MNREELVAAITAALTKSNSIRAHSRITPELRECREDLREILRKFDGPEKVWPKPKEVTKTLEQHEMEIWNARNQVGGSIQLILTAEQIEKCVRVGKGNKSLGARTMIDAYRE